MTDRPNRQQARWLGKTNRRVVMLNGEVITARRHWSEPADGLAIWKSEAEVGKASGCITWWEDSPNTTEARMREMYDDWDWSGRPNSIKEVDDGP